MPIDTEFADIAAPLLWHKINCQCCGLSILDVRLHAALDQLYDLLPGNVEITSLARCARHNADVGGALDSLHLHGRAADIKPLNRDLYLLAITALSIPAFRHGGFGLYPDRGIIHVDVRPRPTRWAKVGQTFTEFSRTWTATFPNYPPPQTPPWPDPSSPAPDVTWR